jgi:flagellar assembly protein FliH
MSRDARRVPAGLVVEVMQYPAPAVTAAATPDALPGILRPIAFAERVAAAERAAFARGVADGERAAAMSASTRVDAIVARFAASIEHLAAARTTLLRDAERDLVRLATAIAEHVLRRQVQSDPALLVSMARAALERLGGATAAIIHVNPADFDAIRRQRPAAAGGGIEILADPAVPHGGCLARTSGGTVDAGLDAQFRELTRALLGEERTRHDDEPIDEA